MVMIASASSIVAYLEHEDSFHFLWRQGLFGLVGLVGLVFASRMRLSWFKRLSPIGMGVSVILLFAVLLTGEKAGGATRWLVVGGSQFQPSEFVKLAVVLFAADILSRRRANPTSLSGLIGPLGVPVLLLCGLILTEPDLGTTLIILVTVFSMFFLAEIKIRELLALAGGGAVAIGILIAAAPYRMARVTAFLDPWADARGIGFQLVQSQLALGSGKWTGVGLGMSRQKFGYLPAPHTDFIFSVIGEELGLVGTMTVVVLFMLLALAVVKIVRHTNDPFGKLLAGGIGSMIISQAFINIGGVISMMPMTGVPLPLVSSGGTSLMATLFAIGILLNLAQQRTGRKKVADREGVNMRRRNGRARLSRTSAGRSA